MAADPLQHALAGGLRPAAPAATATRTAFAVGTLGRLGEELLNVLVESPGYARVGVGTCAPMSSWVAKVVPQRVDDDAPLPPVDDVYCALGGSISRMQRDRAYFAASQDDVWSIAERARAAGARRFVLVAPLDAFTQMSALAAGISNQLESDLSRAGFETLLIVRPTAEDARRGGSAGERLALALGRTIFHYLLPPAVQPLRARKVAEATVRMTLESTGGTRVVSAKMLAEATGGPEDRRRRF